MRILVTGVKGQLGWEIRRQAPDHDCDCIGIDVEEADLTDPTQVDNALEAASPDLIINTAAYTRVDDAQTDTRAAFAVNREAAAHLATACADRDIPMVHVSTDFVFDGKKTDPYVETDPVAPINVYGQSKAAGEEVVRAALDRHLIVRTAWLYGVHGQNFVKSMLRLGRKNPTLRVVSDQIGCPTFAADLAHGLLSLSRRVQSETKVEWGTYHLCGAGAVSWYGFARRIMKLARQLDLAPIVDVVPIATPDYPAPAPRPAFSVMSCRKIKTRFGIAPPPWEASLETMLKRLAVGTGNVL